MELQSSPSFLPKMKILSILARITKNQILNLSLRGVTKNALHEILSFSQIFCQWLYKILRCAMLYPQFGVRKCIFLIIYSVSKAYSFIYSNKHSKQQREKEYVFVCLRYVTGMYSYVIRMSQVCIRMSSLCHSYVFVCHSYVTCIYSYVIHMSLVCGFTINQSRTIEKNPPSFLLTMYRT